MQFHKRISNIKINRNLKEDVLKLRDENDRMIHKAHS